MKELPKVYANQIEKEIPNNKEMFYSKLLSSDRGVKNIVNEIDHIFGDSDFVYKKRVEITTDHDVFETEIVGKSGSFLLTMDGQKISIPSIIDIKKL